MKLTEEETNELVRLYQRMQSAPIVMLDHKHDYHEQCTEDVRRYMDNLGKKYGFDPQKIKGINKQGEIF